MVRALTEGHGVRHRRDRVWHLENGRDASRSGGPGRVREILLFGKARIARVDVRVDEPRKDQLAGGIDLLLYTTACARWLDGNHALVFDPDIRAPLALRCD